MQNRSDVWLAQGFTLFLIIGITYLAYTLGKSNSLLVWSVAILFLVSGIPAFIGGLVAYDRYKEVYDFEPTTFLGRASNGKTARQNLYLLICYGLFSTVGGALLAALLRLGTL